VVTNGGTGNGGGELKPAKQVFVELADRNRVPAEIIGFDADADVALIKIDPEGLDVKPLDISQRDAFAVGEPVAAIGSPFGERQSLSIGVVSATDRTIDSLTEFAIDDAIQTDASINPGNSGGPLLDADGKVIGINQQIETNSGSNSGIGFAIPVDAVRYSLDQLREGGEVDYAYLGVTTQAVWPQLADELGIDIETGALVSEVVSDSPADDAGLQGSDDRITFQGTPIEVGGDVIVAVEGERIVGESDLSELISRRRPGETVTLEIVRGGERQQIEVSLEPRPENPSAG
jgi:S1-C subfamily serine protease